MLRNTFLTHVSRETTGRFPACSEVTLPQLKHLVKTRIALMYQKWMTLHYYTRNMKCKGDEGSACKGAFPKTTQTAAIVQLIPWIVALPAPSAFHLRLLHNKCPWNNWGKAIKSVFILHFIQQPLLSRRHDHPTCSSDPLKCAQTLKYVVWIVFNANPGAST